MPNNPLILNDNDVIDNLWTIVGDDHSDFSQDYLIVPYTLWQTNKSVLTNKVNEGKIGLLLQGEHDIHEENDGVSAFTLIAINFPSFMDGRGFSVARLLRERYQFTGELRATGGVIRDQLCYLQRCGFSSFDLADDIDVTAAAESLKDLTEAYQVSADKPAPLFRRRA
jgi:uncharacterized protein (DUF934 family)